MPNQIHVEMLGNGVEEWNRWRFENSNTSPNLCDADLHGADLHWTDLHGAEIHRANLRGADLRRADLSAAFLVGADLREANLGGADLRGADLNGADLRGAICRGAQLHEAKLCGADLRKALLIRSNLSRANLSGADLSSVHLGETVFFDTDLTEVLNLENAIHSAASNVDHLTLEKSGMLPTIFLRGCGLPNPLIDYYPSLLNQPISFYSCFISYSHDDKVFARRLHDQLQGKGIRCWLDEHQLLPGDDIYDQVDQGIRLWDKVLLCASRSALTSWWVDNEINSAFAKEQNIMKQRKKKVWSLIPLDLDGYMFSGEWDRGLAEQVKSRLAADFKGWETNNAIFEKAFEKTVQALRTDDTGRGTPPPQKI